MTAGQQDDPISEASAGLFALGVGPQRRIETLRLLSELIDLANEHGEVLLDSTLMEAEERLGIDACLEGYEWLERIGVTQRTWSGWLVTNYHAHRGPAGTTAESLAIVERVLARHLATATPPASEMAPVVVLKPWRRRLPVVAAGVAAGIAALAGVSQLTPQAAVSTRNASAGAGATPSSLVSGATSALPSQTTGGTTGATNPTGISARSDALTTTTSTTLLPGLPCVNRSVNDLASRSGLGTKSSAEVPPGVLRCP